MSLESKKSVKNQGITFFICLIILLSAVAILLPDNGVNKEYLRIHIRADSNQEEAQAVKYDVKNAVVEYLTPIIAQLDTKDKAIKRLSFEIKNIESVANAVLEQKGFSYTCKAKLKQEQFPTRSYGSFVLESGVYDAIILELGSAKGDNWWCVVYPPLCFTGESVGYQYKSKIYEIIQNFKEKREEK